MIKDFAFGSLFVTPMLSTTVDLPHEQISKYLRERLHGDRDYTSYYDADFNNALKENLPAREAMELAMKSAAQLYLDNIRYKCREHLDYWFSVYREGDDHILHTHPKAVVAGTYYPYADENSAKIRYRHPAATTIMHALPDADQSGLFHTHYPKTGDMNLWPSWLEHEVRPQPVVDPEKTRIAISFNYGRS